MELTRDGRNLDDNQMLEVLEALQTEMAQKIGVAPPLGSPQGNPWVPGGSSEIEMDYGELDPRWEGNLCMTNLYSSQ